METQYIISELKRNKLIFTKLLENLVDPIIKWKQKPENWCLLEILCHLYDEEREDFRARLIGTLENPDEEFNSIDPVGWVKSRNYIEQNYKLKFEQFINERDISIKLIENLKEPKWDNYYKHPTLGNLSAEMFFTNWLAHDYLHIRQILKIKYDYLANSNGLSLNYAGDW